MSFRLPSFFPFLHFLGVLFGELFTISVKSKSSVREQLALEKIRCASAHSGVDVCLQTVNFGSYVQQNYENYLRGFDVIMEVVTECLNVGYNFVSSLASQVSWEEYYVRSVKIHNLSSHHIPKVT
jgi:hypothetical protein